MKLIYTPKGRAREYSPLALNIYNGCDHGCTYCFNRCGPFAAKFTSTPVPRKDLVKNLERELERRTEPINEQVLLCFTCDPYCRAEKTDRATRAALEVLLKHQVPVSILTKGGRRCLRDLDLFRQFKRIQVGATLTFYNTDQSEQWEPGADEPGGRMGALTVLHDAGIRTWASLEPVMDFDQALMLIEESSPWVDGFKVGKLNHDARAVLLDWEHFARLAVALLRSLRKPFYIKADLRAHLPEGFLTPEECDPDAMNLKGEGR